MALFPKSWLQAKMAVQTPDGCFCSEGCKNRYAAKAVLQNRVSRPRFDGNTDSPPQQGVNGFFWGIKTPGADTAKP